MPNKTAGKKFMVKSSAQNARNKSVKSEVKTYIKKVESAIIGGSKETAMQALKAFESKGMSAVSKGVYQINTIARKVSRLYAKIQKIGA